MLTLAEACDKLRVSDKTLRRLIAAGDIKASKVGGGRWGGSYRIEEDELARYIEGRTVQATA